MPACHPDDLRAFLINVSAETNGPARCDCGASAEAHLLASVTGDGVQCAEAVASLIRERLGAHALVKRVPGLVVDAERSFRRQGTSNLLNYARARDAITAGGGVQRHGRLQGRRSPF